MESEFSPVLMIKSSYITEIFGDESLKTEGREE